jgi:hypothetical protein
MRHCICIGLEGIKKFFFERRQKAFAGFLLDDRKEKKKGVTKLQPQQQTQLYYGIQTKPLY